MRTWQDKKRLKEGYKPIYEQVPPDPQYPDGYERLLVESLEHLHRLRDEYMTLPASQRYLGFDLETSSLDPSSGQIVGASFAWDPKVGYYVPLRHQVGAEHNLDPIPSLDLLVGMLKASSKVLLANARFDLRFLQFAGYDVKGEVDYFDVLIPAWIADTNVREVSLKYAERWFLGWKPETFEEVSKGETNFAFVHPKDGVSYAAFDALGPLNLMLNSPLAKVYQQYRFICDLDNRTILPVWEMEDTPIRIDREVIQGILTEVDARLNELEVEIYALAGQTFKINSPAALSKVLAGLGLDTGIRTKTGMSTKEEFLEQLKDQHPLIGKVIRFKKLLKLRSAYLETLLEYSEGGSCRFAYHTQRVPTGRLASGSEFKNPYFAKINVQSVPKPKTQMYRAHQASPGERSILGWVFEPCERRCSECELRGSCYAVEGKVIKENVRRAFVAPEGFLWVSFDFSQEELRIPANLSGEPAWVNAFLRGEDLHRATALLIEDPQKYSREVRQVAKECNFGLLFGGNRYTIAMRTGKSVDEAQMYINRWWGGLPILRRWCDRQKAKARRKGYVTTYFGRPRYVRYWYASSNWKDNAFADRTVINTQVQGAAADILKIVLIRLYERIINRPEYKGDIYFQSTIHDEVNFIIRESRVRELLPLIRDVMEVRIPGWRVPMKVTASVGRSWGQTFEFELGEEGPVPVRVDLN